MHKRVKVCVRVRPSAKETAGGVIANQQQQTVSVVTNAAAGTGTCFRFDQVLDATVDQSGTFGAAAAEVVESVLSGYNGTVMAYGQTGAGKTFTMSGGRQKFQDRGVCARSISAIFQHIQRDADHSYAVRVSYVEVYNESLVDLLTFSEHPASNNAIAREDLVIQENDKGQTFIRGLARPLVKSEEDAFDLLFQGETNRTIAEHSLNAASTRSHCIFTVYLEKKRSSSGMLNGDDDELQGAEDAVVYSKLNLVDLAGSERMKKTGVSGTMLKEASHINKSLTFLEQVVIALGDKKRQHVPYRQTTLTNLLKDSLGGNCRTLLIACVWPDASHNDQSLATLKFATRMMRVKTSAIVNIAQCGTAKNGGAALSSQALAKLTQEIKHLKEELALYDTLNGRSHVDYDTHTITSPARQELYREQVLSFVRDSFAHPLPILNLLQIQQLFNAFRVLCLEQQSRLEELREQAKRQHSNGDTGNSGSKMVKQLRSLRASSPPDSADSMSQQSRGSHPQLHQHQQYEKLPMIAKIPPASPSPSSPETPEWEEEPQHSRDQSCTLPPITPERTANASRDSRDSRGTSAVLSDKELFELFKKQESPKPESVLDVDLAKQNLRQAKVQFAACGLEVNRLKLEIDGLSLKLQQAPASGSADGDDRQNHGGDSDDSGSIVDSDRPMSQPPSAQFMLVMQLKDAKKRYRERFERFQELRAEVNYLVKIRTQMLAQLTRDFDSWKQQYVRQQCV